MKSLIKVTIVLLLAVTFGCKNNQNKEKKSEESVSEIETIIPSTIYRFSVEDIDGNTFDFKNLKGKKIMIVNTASKCGLTPQYELLEDLYRTYKDDKDFVIIGFPANNFASQEPGDNNEIKEFCSSNFQISFPMMSKISVKGNDIAPIYKFLTSKTENGLQDSEVEWNFQKYLIGRDGKLKKVIGPKTSPKNPVIISWITEEES